MLHGIAFYDLFSNLCDLDPKAHAAININKLKDDCSGHQEIRENSSLLEDPTHLPNTQRCQPRCPKFHRAQQLKNFSSDMEKVPEMPFLVIEKNMQTLPGHEKSDIL